MNQDNVQGQITEDFRKRIVSRNIVSEQIDLSRNVDYRSIALETKRICYGGNLKCQN